MRSCTGEQQLASRLPLKCISQCLSLRLGPLAGIGQLKHRSRERLAVAACIQSAHVPQRKMVTLSAGAQSWFAKVNAAFFPCVPGREVLPISPYVLTEYGELLAPLGLHRSLDLPANAWFGGPAPMQAHPHPFQLPQEARERLAADPRGAPLPQLFEQSHSCRAYSHSTRISEPGGAGLQPSTSYIWCLPLHRDRAEMAAALAAAPDLQNA